MISCNIDKSFLFENKRMHLEISYKYMHSKNVKYDNLQSNINKRIF